ncbi:MAG: TetR/AcrR family transcriptional regulator [Planctomycetes bacterium]|nr:TetR/AcrR family transcriptional regulator [Planctomycetota bacterium]
MPKPKEYDRDEVLGRAMRVFWERGYAATGIANLESAMGINRSSLYHAFGNKRGLFLAALQYYDREVVDTLLGELERSDQGVAAIRGLFDRIVGYQVSAQECRGCFMNSTAGDSAQHSDEVNKLVLAHLARFELGFYKALGRARSLGELTDRVSGDSMGTANLRGQARLLTGVTQGLLVMARAGVAPKVLKSTARSVLATL